MQKKKAILYPYSIHSASIVRNRSMIKHYEIIGAVAPKGLSLLGKDCSAVDSRSFMGIDISEDFEHMILNCEVIIIGEYSLESDEKNIFQQIVFKNTLYALEQGKEVVSLYRFSEEQEEKLKRKSDELKICYFSYKEWQDIKLKKSGSMVQLNTPIISIAGLTEECGKFDIQMSIGNMLARSGINATHISSKQFGELFGFHSFPTFMFGNSLTEEDKILELNAYLSFLESKENPDVFIITVPGGMVPINKRNHERFGITAYEVGCAINPDLLVLAIPLIDLKSYQMDNLCKIVEEKLNCAPCCMAMSNNRINSKDMQDEFKKVSYDFLAVEEVDKKIKGYDDILPVFNSISKQGKEALNDFILDKFFDKDENITSSLNHLGEQVINFSEWLKDRLYKKFDLQITDGSDEIFLSAVEQLYLLADIANEIGAIIPIEQIQSEVLFSFDNICRIVNQNLEIRYMHH